MDFDYNLTLSLQRSLYEHNFRCVVKLSKKEENEHWMKEIDKRCEKAKRNKMLIENIEKELYVKYDENDILLDDNDILLYEDDDGNQFRAINGREIEFPQN